MIKLPIFINYGFELIAEMVAPLSLLALGMFFHNAFFNQKRKIELTIIK
jgi:predicted permease